MTGTPPSFAGTPKAPSADHDVLTEMLRAVRLNGSVFLTGSFSEPFGILSPKRYDAAEPLAHLRHISIFHLVAEGDCTIELHNGETRTATAGDILLIPFADSHRLSNGRPHETGFAPDLVQPGPIKGTWSINYGGGGRKTRMVCGFIESSEFLFAPVFHTLPSILVDRTGDDEVGALLTSTVRQILQLAERAASGSELMLGRLMELLFVEVLRRYAAQLPQGSKGLFAALNDPIVSRALQFVHREPSRRWTVEDLAREAGCSRTVLAERFNAVMGQAPIEYVTSWRMQVASDRIRNTSESLAAIAADVAMNRRPPSTGPSSGSRGSRRAAGATSRNAIRWRQSPETGCRTGRLFGAQFSPPGQHHRHPRI